MTQAELKLFYENKATGYEVSLKEIIKEINLVSNARLAAALTFLGLLYFGLTEHSLFYFLPFIFIGFVLLVRRHSGLFDRKVHFENLIRIHRLELRALDNDISGFDNGIVFVDELHPYSHDLDIFGEGSLYQLLNRCNTRGGKKLLAERLSSPMDSMEEITSHQEAAADLKDRPDFRHEIQARGMEVEEFGGDRQQLQEWITHKSFLYGNALYKIVLIVFPVITLSLLALSFFVDGVARFFWISAAGQWIFLGFHLKRVNEFHQYISRKKNILNKYASILTSIEGETFSSTILKNILVNAKDADQKLRALASLVGGLDARLNSMTNLVVNSLFLYDLQYVYRLEQWKELNALDLKHWLNAVEETEVLCSFGTFAFNHEKFVFPTINTNRNLKGQSMGHPLINEQERIPNDIHLDHEKSIVIITGANMAGKSTFLRTLGVNVVLALAGSPVCAEQFDCPLIYMRSGMRTADSLRDHQSYFYAELNRLKSIVDELKSGKNLLILLDEILKGTNSNDKQAGSIALVKQLVNYPSLVLIATHDLALGDLEKVYPAQIHYYCFEPSITNDELSFNYKLERGIAQKMNATFLMRKMGIIPS